MNFASYTTSEYFPIFLTFYDSIKNNKNLNLYVLCLDDKVEELIINNKIQCKCVSIKEIEKFSKNIKLKKYNNISEKIGVYRLAYADFLLQKEKKEIHLIDSDTYFFSEISNLENIIKNLNASVAFCEHNYAFNKSEMNNLYGIYNAGYMYFKYDEDSLKFLKSYRELCQNYISWEVKEKIKNIFADQTYLEKLKDEFDSIKIIDNVGVNCAPWNIGNYQISQNNIEFKVNDKKLIFYHFSGIRSIFNKIFFFNLYHYNKKNLHNVKKTIYKIYLKNLQKNLNICKSTIKPKNIKLKKIILFIYKVFRKDFLIL